MVTDLPKPRTYCAIESPTHGNVLWAALDHGVTRIGYAFTTQRQRSYETFDQDAAVKKAIEAVKPSKLRFMQVDWWTIYVVGQRVAAEFLSKDCVFLAGDACHTHSSGAAQGMNTGIHDAVKLAWKLSLVLVSLAKPELLTSYEAERRPNVAKLISYDKDIARLMTMQLPEDWTGDPKANPNELLSIVMKEAASFSSGLSIGYPVDDLLNIQGSLDCGQESMPRQRVPDVPLQKLGTLEAIRMHKVTPNIGLFYVVAFVSHTAVTQTSLKSFANALTNSSFLNQTWLQFLIIAKTIGSSAYELLGIDPSFARVFYDKTGEAHARYGVDITKGAIYDFRPDGWIGTALPSGEAAAEGLERYFQKVYDILINAIESRVLQYAAGSGDSMRTTST